MKRRFAVPLAALLLIVVGWGAMNLYRPAKDAERADIVAPVAGYFAAKARLATDLSIADFWRSYPDLARDYDLRSGVNIEPLFAKSMQELKATNYRTELERYEAIRVYVRGDSAIAMVHGMDHWDNANGGPTSGEVNLVFTLRSVDGHWTVIRSDEQMMGEHPPTEPPHLP